MNATDMSRDRYVSQLTHTTTTKQKHGGYPVEGYEAGDDCNQRDSVLLIIF